MESFGEPLKSGLLATQGFLARATALGFRAVELCDLTVDRGNPHHTRNLLDGLGLRCPSIAVRNDFTTADMCEDDLRKVLAWLHIANRVGASVLRVYTGKRAEDRNARKRVEHAFDRIVPVAERRGIILAVETHGGLSNDVEFMRSLVSRHHGRVGICVDFGNVPRQAHLAYVEKLAPVAVHVHVKSYDFDQYGRETSLDLPGCLRVLKGYGYNGQWVVEYEGRPPYEEGIRRTTDIMADVLL
jgi:sugar phosphate isomerase/epimerase